MLTDDLKNFLIRVKKSPPELHFESSSVIVLKKTGELKNG